MNRTIKKLSYSIGIYLLLISSCTSNSNSESAQILENGIIEINTVKATQEARAFPLSKIVTEIDFIQLESTVKSYFNHMTSLSVTDNFILIASTEKSKVLLFDREGDFIRQIGKTGRGPGEYLKPLFASMDPRERFVIVKDAFSGNLFKYDMEGSILEQVNIKDICPTDPNNQPVFIDDNHFALSFDRPSHPVDNHFNIAIFDLELNLIERKIPIPNNDSLCLKNLSSQDIFEGTNSNYYWENCIDILYSIQLSKKSQAKYYINMDGTGQSIDYLTGRNLSKNGLEFNLVLSITDLPRYLLFALYNDFEGLSQVIFDKKKFEAFKIDDQRGCFSSLPNGSEATLWDNDIFGYPKIIIDFYFSQQNLLVSPINLERVSPTELECLKEMDVLNPEKRDHLVKMVESASGEELPLLVFMTTRKK